MCKSAVWTPMRVWEVCDGIGGLAVEMYLMLLLMYHTKRLFFFLIFMEFLSHPFFPF